MNEKKVFFVNDEWWMMKEIHEKFSSLWRHFQIQCYQLYSKLSSQKLATLKLILSLYNLSTASFKLCENILRLSEANFKYISKSSSRFLDTEVRFSLVASNSSLSWKFSSLNFIKDVNFWLDSSEFALEESLSSMWAFSSNFCNLAFSRLSDLNLASEDITSSSANFNLLVKTRTCCPRRSLSTSDTFRTVSASSYWTCKFLKLSLSKL